VVLPNRSPPVKVAATWLLVAFVWMDAEPVAA